MADSKEYYTQKAENGSIQISEDVVASVAAMAGVKSVAKGIRVTSDKEGRIFVDCNVVANFGYSVFELAKTVQEAVKSSLESVTGLCVGRVNVNICGIALPREAKK